MSLSTRARTIGVVVGIALFVALGMVLSESAHSGAQTTGDSHPLPADVVAPALDLSRAFETVSARVRPVVVSVYSEKIVRVRSEGFPSGPGDDLFRQFFGPGLAPFEAPREQSIPQHGMGSGILLDGQGNILTNNHVVDGVDQIRVRLADRRTFSAKVVSADPKADIAVIRIEGDVPSDLPSARFADSDSIRVGDLVLAVGAPFGLTQTVTQGIISATGRSNVGIEDYEDFLQTDAPINPGNSGGPLVDMRGNVVGMNTAIATQIGQSAGVGFAIPANLIRKELPTLLQGGTITRGLLGVLIQDVTPDLAKQFHLPNDQGALVAQVQKDSPADRAGLASGDVVVRFKGQTVEDTRQLRNLVAETSPGQRVSVMVIRDGREKAFEVKIGSLESSSVAQAASPQAGKTALDQLGLEVVPLTPELARNAGVDDSQGVVIASIHPGTAASMSGLQPGDVIVEADRKPVASVRQLDEILASSPDKASVLLRIDRRGGSLYVVLNAPSS
jgi:serine protease Do